MATIQVGNAATIGEKELKTKYPKTKGLIAGTTKQTGNKIWLVPRDGTNIAARKRIGL